MKGILYSLGRRAAPAFIKARWIYRSLTGDESQRLEAEYTMGCYLASVHLREVRHQEDPSTDGWLNSLVADLKKALVNRDRRFQARCLTGPGANAFALPGGFVFITRPLLELCGRDRDEVAFVLAHEMAHVIRNHSFHRLLGSELAQLLARCSPGRAAWAPAARRLIHQLVTQGYSRTQEFEADRAAARIVKVAGFDPHGGVRLLTRLKSANNDQAPDALASYFSSHPPLASRIGRIERFLEASGFHAALPPVELSASAPDRSDAEPET